MAIAIHKQLFCVDEKQCCYLLLSYFLCCLSVKCFQPRTIQYFSIIKWQQHGIYSLNLFGFDKKQDGPSLESSSYLNESLRYLGPLDPWTFEPSDLGTLGPLPPPTPPHTSPYILLPPPISSSYSHPLVWFC